MNRTAEPAPGGGRRSETEFSLAVRFENALRVDAPNYAEE